MSKEQPQKDDSNSINIPTDNRYQIGTVWELPSFLTVASFPAKVRNENFANYYCFGHFWTFLSLLLLLLLLLSFILSFEYNVWF